MNRKVSQSKKSGVEGSSINLPGQKIESAGKNKQQISKTLYPDQIDLYSEGIVETIREPLLVLDSDLRVLFANQNFQDVFKVDVRDTIGKRIFDLGNQQWDIPKLHTLLERIIPKHSQFNNYRVEHSFPSIGRRVMLLNARRILKPPEQRSTILLAFEDITERIHTQQALQDSEERFRRAFETAKDGMLLVDKSGGQILNSNPAVQNLLGYSVKNLLNKRLWEIGFLKNDGDFKKAALQLEKNGVLVFNDTTIKTRNGREIPADVHLMDRAKVIQCNLRDITGRKILENKLNEDKLRYQELFNNISSGAAVYEAVEDGRDFIFLDFNKAAEKIEKTTRKKVLGHKVSQVFPGIQEMGLLEAFRRVWKTGKPEHHPISLYKDKRLTGWRENYVYKLPSGEIVTVYEDLTEKKMVEEKLNWLASFPEVNPLMVIEVDRKGHIVYVNPTVRKQLPGFELVGNKHPFLKNIPKAIEQLDQQNIKTTTTEVKIGERWFSQIVCVISNNLNIRIYAYDVTDRKQADEIIFQFEKELKAAQSVAQVGSWRWDIKNNRLTWSDEMYNIFGISKEKFSGNLAEVIARAIHPDDRAAVEASNRSVIRNRKPIPLEYRIIRPDGSIHWVYAEAGELILDEKGKASLLTGIVQDISESKQFQQSLLIMSDTQRQLTRLQSIGEVVQLLGKKILELFADCYVVFSMLDEEKQATRTAGLFGFGPVYEKLKKTYKIDPSRYSYLQQDMTPEETRLFRSGKLEEFPGGTYALMTRKFPKMVCKAGEKQLKISKIYTQGLIDKGDYLGVIAILARGDITPYKEMIEIIIQQASITLNRIKSRMALEESEERFRSLYENATIGMYRTTQGGKILMANPTLVKMMGYASFEELARRDLNQAGYQTDYPRREFKHQIEQQGKIQGRESSWKRKDGSLIYVRESARVVRDGNGRVLYYEGTVEDVSERHKAEQALQKSETRFRLFFEESPIGYQSLDIDGNILDVNPQWIAMLGYAKDEVIGHSFCEFVIPEQKEIFNKRFTQFKAAGEVHGVDYEMLRKDGTHFLAEIDGRIAYDQDGNFKQSHCVINDVTAVSESEKALKESEERYRDIFEDSPISLWEEDYSAVKQWLDSLRAQGVSNLRAYLVSHPKVVAECTSLIRVLDVNQATLKLYRAKKKEDLFGSMPKIVHNELSGYMIDELMHIAEGQTHFSSEGIDQTLDGEKIDIMLNWAVVPGYESDFSKVIISIIDITERKKMEKLLKDSEKRFRDIAENSQEWIWEVNPQGKYTFASQMVEKILGYTPDEILQKHFYDLVHPEDRETTKASAFAVFTAKHPFREFINHSVHKNGQSVWLATNGIPLLDDQGNLLGYRGADTDITERILAEEKIRISEARYRALFEDSPISLLEEDFSAIKQRLDALCEQGVTDMRAHLEFHPQEVADCAALIKVLDINKTALGLYKANTKDEFLKAHQSLIVPPQLNQNFREELVNISEGLTNFTHERVSQTLTGESIDISFSWSVAPGHEGDLSRVLISVVDITQRKQAEREMRRLINDLRNLSAVEKKERMLAEALARNVISLRSTLKTDEILDSIIETIGQVVPSDAISIMLLRGEYAQVVRSSGFKERGLLDWLNQKKFNPAELKIYQDVIISKKFKIIPNTEKDKNWITFAESAWIKSNIITPIMEDDKVVGFVNVDSSTPDFYTTEHAQHLTIFTDQVSTALKNARLFEATQKRMNRMQAMTQIDQAINSSLDVNISLEIVLMQAKEQLQADAVAILLMDDVTHSLVFSRAKGFQTDEIKKANLKLGSGLPGRAVMERTTVAIPDLSTAPESYFKNMLVEREGFVSYYCAPLITKGQLKGVLEIYFRHTFQADREWLEFLEMLAQQTAIAINNAELLQSLQTSNVELLRAYEATLKGWVDALDMRDQETEGHTRRVTEISLKLAKRMGIKDTDLVNFERGALLHDIGKVAVPDAILKKPGPLTEEEWVIMRRHPLEARILLSKSKYLIPALDIPFCHHEKWDGSGYPLGLKGEAIPLAARIFAIVDVWDALTSDRPYRKAWTKKKTLAHIKEQTGKHFDPQIAPVFLDMIQEEQP